MVEKPVSVMFRSESSKIHGRFYRISGAGPFPTVILCHGSPGNDMDVLGLGQRLAKEGFNALSFNYRGTWGSGGTFTGGKLVGGRDFSHTVFEVQFCCPRI